MKSSDSENFLVTREFGRLEIERTLQEMGVLAGPILHRGTYRVKISETLALNPLLHENP